MTWRDVAVAAGQGKFKFAMTDPSTSNSGFAGLVGVASALAGTGSALQVADIDPSRLADFFRGQSMTEASSGFLEQTYLANQGTVDGMVNYESELLHLNASTKLQEQFALIYPKDGIATADYPLTLLDRSQRDAYQT